MCIILPKEEEVLKQQPQNKWVCQNQQSQQNNNLSMVTPSKNNLSSKSGQGGTGGNNKRSQHQNQHHMKRHQNSQSTSASMRLSTSASLQKGIQSHNKSNQTNHGNKPHLQHNRTSPNLSTNNFNNINNQKNQQRQNRQTPPRNMVGNYVNMNNGQPSLERTESNPIHTQKNATMSQSKEHSQKSLQNGGNHQKAQKGHTITVGSRASPISANISKSNRSSPQGFAGSKCFEPPTPNSLPKPPSDWTPLLISNTQNIFGKASQSLTFDDMLEAHADSALDNHISVSSARDVSQELKLILNVHA